MGRGGEGRVGRGGEGRGEGRGSTAKCEAAEHGVCVYLHTCTYMSILLFPPSLPVSAATVSLSLFPGCPPLISAGGRPGNRLSQSLECLAKHSLQTSSCRDHL